MPFGLLDTTYVDLSQNIDSAYIEGLQNGSGMDFARLLREIDQRMGGFNTGADALLASFIYPTQEVFIDQATNVPFDVQEAGEYSLARPQYTDEIPGYMLPLRKWDAAVGWTEDGLRTMKLTSILNQLDNLLLGFRLRFRKEVIRRLFSDAEVRVEKRSTSLAPGFAGSGTGLNVYQTPYPNGSALPGGYTHYIRTDAAGLGAALDSAIAKFKDQGIEGPYDLIAPKVVIDQIRALTGTGAFVGVGSALVRPATSTTEALVDPQVYIGVVRDEIRVRPAIADFTQPNFAVYKSYGPMNTRNPLAVRFPDEPGMPNGGRAAYIRSRSLYPLDHAEVVSWWGVGVSNRIAAVLGHIAASGNYVAPTIS